MSLGITNNGYNVVVGAHLTGANYYARAWVAHLSDDNESWYLTIVDPNTGATINNTALNVRYTLITLKTASPR